MKILLQPYGRVITIDEADLAHFSAHRWYVKNAKRPYVFRNEDGKCLFLHRVLLEAPKGMVVDHIDGNCLNNSRANLRLATHEQNLWNRTADSGSVGVYFHERRALWRATISHKNKKLDLGYYRSEVDARTARDMICRKLRGEFGAHNYPPDAHLIADALAMPPTARRLLFATA